jgi:hypothetical protein
VGIDITHTSYGCVHSTHAQIEYDRLWQQGAWPTTHVAADVSRRETGGGGGGAHLLNLGGVHLASLPPTMHPYMHDVSSPPGMLG